MGMENKNCVILSEYMRSILHDDTIRKPELEKLEEPFHELGAEMELLQQAVEELKNYSKALSQGDLSVEFPSQENLLCENLKKLHANLKELTRQAKQAAAGDYSQKMSCLGEVSGAFHSMTEQFGEREEKLKEEKEQIHARAEVLGAYNKFWTEMTRKRNEWVLAIDARDQSVLYCNKSLKEKKSGSSVCEDCGCRDSMVQKLREWDSEQPWIWEFEDENGKFFSVDSFPGEWKGRRFYVHVVEDVTEERREKDDLASKVYFDTAFGVRNRRFFTEYMDHVLREKTTVTLCYLDMDDMKYVNDFYGHLEGDKYIEAFVGILQHNFRKEDVLARVGGDEFVLILGGSLEELAVSKLERVRNSFREENRKGYLASFSYGIYVIDGETNEKSLEEIMECVDSSMYAYKRKYKPEK